MHVRFLLLMHSYALFRYTYVKVEVGDFEDSAGVALQSPV